MKKSSYTSVFILVLLLFPFFLIAQCIPGDATSCPDPENNGEICPDTLPNAIFNQLYSQDFTILAPPEFIVDTNAGIVIDLHHIKLIGIDNLPPGLTWISNASDSVFMVGTYYCVLMEGIPEQKGQFPLHIEVDVYVPGILGSPPIKVATIIDSTSLLINVTDPSGVGQELFSNLTGLEYAPNPFYNQIELKFTHTNSEQVTFEVFNLLGTRLHHKTFRSAPGINHISYDAPDLEPGLYLFSIRDAQHTYTGRIIKSK